jgi:hypothetical protein
MFSELCVAFGAMQTGSLTQISQSYGQFSYNINVKIHIYYNISQIPTGATLKPNIYFKHKNI